MPTRKAARTPDEPQAEGPVLLRTSMPTRLLAHDWPFLYSVLRNGDLVLNKRLPAPPAQKRPRRQVLKSLGDAPF